MLCCSFAGLCFFASPLLWGSQNICSCSKRKQRKDIWVFLLLVFLFVCLFVFKIKMSCCSRGELQGSEVCFTVIFMSSAAEGFCHLPVFISCRHNTLQIKGQRQIKYNNFVCVSIKPWGTEKRLSWVSSATKKAPICHCLIPSGLLSLTPPPKVVVCRGIGDCHCSLLCSGYKKVKHPRSGTSRIFPQWLAVVSQISQLAVALVSVTMGSSLVSALY